MERALTPGIRDTSAKVSTLQFSKRPYVAFAACLLALNILKARWFVKEVASRLFTCSTFFGDSKCSIAFPC